jgi:hypothetical protein
MPEFTAFHGLRLRGGFTIIHLEFVPEPLVDAFGRAVLASTQIVGKEIRITVLSTLDEKETSVTLYHEILEAMTVAVDTAPLHVRDYNEADFEKAGYEAYDQLGPASPSNIDRMLLSFGFEED